MTKKEILGAMPKAKATDIRIIFHNGKNAMLSVVPLKEVDERNKAFEKRASLETEDRKNQETQGSIRLWAADLLNMPSPNKNSTALIPSAALWMTLMHWKNGDRNAKQMKKLTSEKKPAFLIISHADKVGKEDKMTESSWSFGFHDELDIEETQFYAIAPDSVRLV